MASSIRGVFGSYESGFPLTNFILAFFLWKQLIHRNILLRVFFYFLQFISNPTSCSFIQPGLFIILNYCFLCQLFQIGGIFHLLLILRNEKRVRRLRRIVVEFVLIQLLFGQIIVLLLSHFRHHFFKVLRGVRLTQTQLFYVHWRGRQPAAGLAELRVSNGFFRLR